MKLKSFILLLLTLSLFSNISLAEDVRYYDFEIIIFESLSEEDKIAEVWKDDVVIDPPEPFVTLGKPYPGPMPKQYVPKHTFKFLPKKSYRLLEEAKYLKENDQYRILMHSAWRQPGMAAETTLPIHLHKEFIVTEKAKQTPVKTDPDMPAVNLPAPLATTTRSKAVLDGYLRIVLSRYLHADFNLVYKTGLPLTPMTTTISANQDEDGDAINTAEPAIVSYQLQQTRKMRSKEVHYIDHPVLGVVILAWPYLGEDVRSN